MRKFNIMKIFLETWAHFRHFVPETGLCGGSVPPLRAATARPPAEAGPPQAALRPSNPLRGWHPLRGWFGSMRADPGMEFALRANSQSNCRTAAITQRLPPAARRPDSSLFSLSLIHLFFILTLNPVSFLAGRAPHCGGVAHPQGRHSRRNAVLCLPIADRSDKGTVINRMKTRRVFAPRRGE
jgi:hypothetical protein